MAPILIRTGIPDELDGQRVAFANVFERAERPGGLSVLFIHEDSQTVVASGDILAVGGRRYRLEAIEPQGNRYVVALQPLPAEAETPPPRLTTEFDIPPIGAHALAAVLKGLSTGILGHLAPDVAVPPILDWAIETRDTMTKEWNGGETGPITTTTHAARFDPSALPAEATVSVDDIRYAPDVVERQEVSAYWRAGEARASVFLRGEKTAPMTRLLADPRYAPIVELIAAAIRGSTP